MGEFLRGWKRKIGCVTLLMALVMMLCWLRSLSCSDTVRLLDLGHEYHVVSSWHGGLWWERHIETSYEELRSNYPNFPSYFSVHEENGMMVVENFVHIRWNFAGFEFSDIASSGNSDGRPDNSSWEHIHLIGMPHWSITIPLTLLSSYLILWPGKRPERKSKAPVEDK